MNVKYQTSVIRYGLKFILNLMSNSGFALEGYRHRAADRYKYVLTALTTSDMCQTTLLTGLQAEYYLLFLYFHAFNSDFVLKCACCYHFKYILFFPWKMSTSLETSQIWSITVTMHVFNTTLQVRPTSELLTQASGIIWNLKVLLLSSS